MKTMMTIRKMTKMKDATKQTAKLMKLVETRYYGYSAGSALSGFTQSIFR